VLGRTLTIDLEQLLDAKHPIRQVKPMCAQILASMYTLFDEIYAEDGRPSMPPERLLMGWVLMALFSVRSCRQFAEQLRYNMLFKWFLDMNPDEVGFDASTFSKNMERFQRHRLSELFFARVVQLADEHGWISQA
jgi:transposase